LAELVGYVLPENTASQRAFVRAGFFDRGAGADGSRAFARSLTS
jgi:RimJ/RimL family protein N-acetyltransferase